MNYLSQIVDAVKRGETIPTEQMGAQKFKSFSLFRMPQITLNTPYGEK